MNLTKKPLGEDPITRSRIVPSPLRIEPEVREQPVPRAAARIVSHGGRGTARDRLLLWSQYGPRFRRAMSDVRGTLPQEWAAAEGRRTGDISALADLAAVRLYLAEEWAWVDPMLLDGNPGAHMPLARCVSSGLRRLPGYRGPAIARIGVTDALLGWYRRNPVLVDRGFWSAASSPAALGAAGPGYLVWSLTGRRTDPIDPYAPGRLVFAPGTRFKVLGVIDGREPRVMMREMFPQETAGKARDGSGARNTAWLDATTVEELTRATAGTPGRAFVACTCPWNRAPGLIAPR
ncbi:hypothetical protein [Streptomyces sp. NPDC001930]|uniref:hypothetical protein n=1 Tax=Streptomyces sp. NPDC001930 TaxID=3364625 RepID=UPI0036B8FB9F